MEPARLVIAFICCWWPTRLISAMEKVQSVYEIKVVIKYTATNAFRVITFVVAVFGLIQQYSREI